MEVIIKDVAFTLKELPIKFLGLLFSDILNFDMVYNNKRF